jgi:hypothetical protein
MVMPGSGVKIRPQWFGQSLQVADASWRKKA